MSATIKREEITPLTEMREFTLGQNDLADEIAIVTDQINFLSLRQNGFRNLDRVRLVVIIQPLEAFNLPRTDCP